MVACAAGGPLGCADALSTRCSVWRQDRTLKSTYNLPLLLRPGHCEHSCRCRLPSALRMVGSNPSCSSLIQRKPSTADTNCSPSRLMLNWADAIPPSQSNSHSRTSDPQRVKPCTNLRLSWAASTSLAYIPWSSPAVEAISADALLLSSPGMRICDQWNLESTPELESSTKPTSNSRIAIEPYKCWCSCTSGRRRAPKAGWSSPAKSKSWPMSHANQLKTSLSSLLQASSTSRLLLGN